MKVNPTWKRLDRYGSLGWSYIVLAIYDDEIFGELVISAIGAIFYESGKQER